MTFLFGRTVLLIDNDSCDVVADSVATISNRSDAWWRSRSVEFAQFVTANGRLPSQYGDARERSIRYWLSKQRSWFRVGRLPLWKMELLDAAAPAWRGGDSYQQLWEGTLSELVAFIRRNGRFPSRHNGVVTERHLGDWVNTQRTVMPESYRVIREKLLDAKAPGWRTPLREKPTESFRASVPWGERVDLVVEFVATHGVLPTRKQSSEAERLLGAFLMNQRKALATGIMPAERAAELDDRVPGWRDAPRTNWERAVLVVAVWVEANGLPESHSSVGPEGASMNERLTKQRRRADAGKLTVEQIAFLDEHIPGWRSSVRRQQWDAGIARLARLVTAADGKHPSTQAADDEERACGFWLEKRKAAYRAGKLTAEQIGDLDRAAPGWQTKITVRR